MTEEITCCLLREQSHIDRLRGDITRSRFISRMTGNTICGNTEHIPTMTGQSLERPGQSVGKKPTYGNPTDG